jgi:peptidoglycan hydrolase-like protein with peptidoglycan-binding domain
MHLRSAIRPNLPVTGMFGAMTRSAVREFQDERGMRANGVIGQETWRALLSFEPVRLAWGSRKRRRAGAATASRAPSRPLSASLSAKAYEIDPGPAP